VKDIKLTLYDIFGYLVPGIVFLLGLMILYWTVFLNETRLTFPSLSTAKWLGLAVTAYLLGHMAQAIANLLPGIFPEGISLVSARGDDKGFRELLAAGRRKLAKKLEEQPNRLTDSAVIAISTRAVKLSGGASVDEIYEHRAGFYRGLAVSSSLVAVALVMGAARNIAIEIPAPHLMGAGGLLGTAACFGGFGVLSGLRYRRFAARRVHQALLALVFTDATRGRDQSSDEG